MLLSLYTLYVLIDLLFSSSGLSLLGVWLFFSDSMSPDLISGFWFDGFQTHLERAQGLVERSTYLLQCWYASCYFLQLDKKLNFCRKIHGFVYCCCCDFVDFCNGNILSHSNDYFNFFASASISVGIPSAEKKSQNASWDSSPVGE